MGGRLQRQWQGKILATAPPTPSILDGEGEGRSSRHVVMTGSTAPSWTKGWYQARGQPTMIQRVPLLDLSASFKAGTKDEGDAR